MDSFKIPSHTTRSLNKYLSSIARQCMSTGRCVEAEVDICCDEVERATRAVGGLIVAVNNSWGINNELLDASTALMRRCRNMRNLSIQSIKALEVIRKENAVLRQDFLHMKQEVDAEIYKALEMVAHYRSKVMQPEHSASRYTGTSSTSACNYPPRSIIGSRFKHRTVEYSTMFQGRQQRVVVRTAQARAVKLESSRASAEIKKEEVLNASVTPIFTRLGQTNCESDDDVVLLN